jgi:predicted DNA binding CopG/RHH family protein
MNITIQIVSLKDKSLTPQVRKVDLSQGRPTEVIGNAVRSLVEKCSVSYKQPCLQVIVDKEVRGEFTPKGKTFAEKIRSVNFGITEIILNSRFTIDELTFNKHSKDSIALNIAKAFGHKGAAISVDVASNNLMAVEKAIKVNLKYARIDANDLYESFVPKHILEAEAQAKAERKALSVSKKALQLTEGK